MDDESERIEALLERLRAKDEHALAELFSHYRAQLDRMVSLRLDHRLGGRVSASDVLQESYLDAAKRVEHYLARPEMPFFLWLRLITNQCLVDVHRRHLHAQRRDAGLEQSLYQGQIATASSVCMAACLIEDVPSPSQAALDEERSSALQRALESLDPIDREVLALRHFEELSNNEVAQILGLQKHAASKRYVRALARLKTALTAMSGFSEDG